MWEQQNQFGIGISVAGTKSCMEPGAEKLPQLAPTTWYQVPGTRYHDHATSEIFVTL